MTRTDAGSSTGKSKLSVLVKRLGYDGSPLPLAEWLSLRATILSMPEAATFGRISLPPAIVSCAHCGAETVKAAFELRKHEKRGLAKLYCRPECWSAATNAARFGVRLCTNCRQPAPKATSCGSDRTPYCSRECLLAWREKRKEATRKARPRVVCDQCNQEFSVDRGRWNAAQKKGETLRCSKRCSARAHSFLMSDQGNPKWKDGATRARQQPHCARAFREMRPLVRERDGHRCVLCGSGGRRLEVHHLDENPMNNAAANLVTLCAKHHRQWHAAKDSIPSVTLWPWLKTYASRPLCTTSKSKETTTSSRMAS